MDRPLPHSSEESFVIRVSAVDAMTSPGGWRATVVHVASGERHYVSTYAELCAFIESRRRRSTARG